MLAEEGYDVLASETMAEALTILRDLSRQVDVLLTDLVMPDLSGLELMQAAREVRPGLPVVIMSGYAGDNLTQQGLTDAGARFLAKPFSALVLTETVRAALDDPRGS